MKVFQLSSGKLFVLVSAYIGIVTFVIYFKFKSMGQLTIYNFL